jgi:hypothetical protein
MNSFAAVGLYLQPNGRDYWQSFVFIFIGGENT